MINESRHSIFFSWKTKGIKGVFILILGTAMLSCFESKSNETGEENTESKTALNSEHVNKIEELDTNESESLEHYKNISQESNPVFLDELSRNIIPKWEKNISILKELVSSKDVSLGKIEQFKKRLKYSELRLEAFLLIKKAVTEDTDKYNDQINMLSSEINRVGESINQ